MDNFVVSALKYRPNDFSTVIGQDSLVKTLKNAIAGNHLAHAYLFCGPRGVGKTTCARIFAKTINCENHTPDHEACNKCESCVSFNEQRSYNIQELDAASNNGTDDIKYLIEQVRIPPQLGKYRVYIIDEVHMLSSAAFNAFLKTLEEPPAHAIFILATTEKHKIIPTILSRCQIYDFNRITVSDTVKHLQYVAEKEGVNVDVNGLNVIAQKSNGGMRDALSIFDQLVSFCGNNITYQGVIENLNVLDYEYYFKMVECFLASDHTNALLLLNEIINKGFDANHFVTGLSSHLRDLLVCKDTATIQLLEVGADIGERYAKQAKICHNEFIFSALKLSNDCDLDYRLSKNKRLLVELMLIRLCQLTDQKKKSELTGTTSEKIVIAPLKPSGNVSDQKKEIITANKQPGVPENTVKQSPEKYTPKNNNTPLVLGTRPAGISIKKSSNQEVTTGSSVEVENKKELLNQPFSKEQFYTAWNNFSGKITNNVIMVNFIQNNEPVLNEDNSFEVVVTNVMLEKDIKSLEKELLFFLRNELKNSTIKMIIKLNENIEKIRSLSHEEQYNEMIKRNPALEILKQNLSLEID